MNYTDAAMPEISAGVRAFVDECERECADVFKALDEIEKYNTEKVLLAFQRHRIALRHFAPSNGYGYDDIGRDTLDRLYADIMGAEDALVRRRSRRARTRLRCACRDLQGRAARCWRLRAGLTTRWSRSSACRASRAWVRCAIMA